MSYWVAGATVVSGVVGSMGASSAAKKQQSAAEAAARMRMAMYNEGRQTQAPWLNAGSDAISQLTQRLPELTAAYDPQKLLQEPGYEFGRAEGQRGLEQSLAAKGLTDSGAALKRAARYGTDYATTKLNDAFNRDRASRNDSIAALMGVSNSGQRSAENISQLGMTAATGAAGDRYAGANAGAANDVSQGNILGGVIGQLGGLMGGMSSPSGVDTQFNYSQGAGADGTGNYSNEGRNSTAGRYLADGGRVEPVVGTRAPRRAGGTGGGMDRKAVLDALDVAWRDVPATPQPGTIAALPANPVTQPGAITDARMRQAGAYAEGGKVCDYSTGGAVRGKSTGKADKVTAHLSGGEHVIDAEVVSMLGDGNSEAGHALLDELRRRVREFKRNAPPDRTAEAING